MEDRTVARVAAMEDMNLICQPFDDYLTGTESQREFTLNELMAAFQSFCFREPAGRLFLEAVVEEPLERVEDGAPILKG
jgi:hypothetical protein